MKDLKMVCNAPDDQEVKENVEREVYNQAKEAYDPSR